MCDANVLGLTWSHLASLGLTWSHLVSHGLTWSQLVSHGLTWFAWTHLVRFIVGLTSPDKFVGVGLTSPHKYMYICMYVWAGCWIDIPR